MSEQIKTLKAIKNSEDVGIDATYFLPVTVLAWNVLSLSRTPLLSFPE